MPVTFLVPDMTCGHCKAAIEGAIAKAGGRVTVDLDSKSVTVEGLDPAQAESVIRDEGFTPRT